MDYILLYKLQTFKMFLVALIFIILTFVLSYVLDNAVILKYDDKTYLHINLKGNINIIPHKNIYKMELSMIKINHTSVVVIQYKDENKVKKTVRFLPRLFSKNFKDFVYQVQLANSNFEYKNWKIGFW